EEDHSAMTDLLNPTALKKITDDAEMAKAREALAHMNKEKDEIAALHEAFMTRQVHPDVKQRLNAAVSRAAEKGLREIQVISCPACYCNDGGRRINNAEADWPASLEGFAKVAMEYYEKDLKPLGYHVQARILDFPGGMPGNVGLFLRW